MKKLLSLLLACVLLCAAAACSTDVTEPVETAPATEAPTEALEPQISAANNDIMVTLETFADEEVSGVLYAEKDGEPCAVYAYGTLHSTPITIDTPMPIGSVSKQFCAAAILLLQEQGKLSVNDTLDRYFPDYEYAPEITLDLMLCHRSGIPDITEGAEDVEKVKMDHTDAENTAVLLEWLYAQPLNFTPGEHFEYSNVNFILLGNIVEMVSGTRYIDFLRENFFVPLGMEHTGSIFELKDSPAWAEGFSYEPSELSIGIEPGISKGAGDIISNAADMTAWMNGLSSGKIISKESYQTMIAVHSPGNNYGYGIYSELSFGLGHFGGIGIFSACDYLNPDDGITLFMASSSVGQKIPDYLYEIEAALRKS